MLQKITDLLSRLDERVAIGLAFGNLLNIELD